MKTTSFEMAFIIRAIYGSQNFTEQNCGGLK